MSKRPPKAKSGSTGESKAPVSIDEIWPDVRRPHGLKTQMVAALDAGDRIELRRRIRKRIGAIRKSGDNAAERLNAQRFYRRVVNDVMRSDKESSRVPLGKRLLAAQCKDCAILDALYPGRKSVWLPAVKRRRPAEVVLEKFSLIENPIGTMRMLHDIAVAEANAAPIAVHFGDAVCLDLSPYLILGLMQPNMLPVVTGGNVTVTVQSMLHAVELDRFLGMSLSSTKGATFVPFPVRYRMQRSTSKNTAFEPSTKEKLSDDLVKTINSWLSLQKGNVQLTKDGKGNVARIVGELLDNAERHGDLTQQDGDWAIAGFLSMVKYEEDGHVSATCNLAVASIGATISESMAVCEDDRTRSLIDKYIGLHQRRGRYSSELLTTVYALQDKISRFRLDDHRSSGGIGLMDMMQFVDELGSTSHEKEAPRITLISGKSCVTLRDRYRRGVLPSEGAARRLWFNESNTLEDAPDPAYVMDLPFGFPGTLVAIRFAFDAEHVSGL